MLVLGGTSPEDLLTQCLYCLLGLGTGGLRGRLAFDDEALLFYAGHFAHYPRSAVSLERLLADYFELPVARPAIPRTMALSRAKTSQSSLPCARWPEGLNTQLGAQRDRRPAGVGRGGQVPGARGAAGLRRLPPPDALRRRAPAACAQMIRTYAGPQFEFDVQVVLKAAEVPCCRLGGDGADPSRLGWNTWVLSAASRSRRFRRRFFLGRLIMDHINLKSLVGKLNDTCRGTLEAAAGLCLSRTHYNVEIEHWLLKLVEVSDADLAAVFRHYGVDTSRLARDLTAVIDRFKTGNSRPRPFRPTS